MDIMPLHQIDLPAFCGRKRQNDLCRRPPRGDHYVSVREVARFQAPRRWIQPKRNAAAFEMRTRGGNINDPTESEHYPVQAGHRLRRPLVTHDKHLMTALAQGSGVDRDDLDATAQVVVRYDKGYAHADRIPLTRATAVVSFGLQPSVAAMGEH